MDLLRITYFIYRKNIIYLSDVQSPPIKSSGTPALNDEPYKDNITPTPNILNLGYTTTTELPGETKYQIQN